MGAHQCLDAKARREKSVNGVCNDEAECEEAALARHSGGARRAMPVALFPLRNPPRVRTRGAIRGAARDARYPRRLISRRLLRQGSNVPAVAQG